MKKSEANIASLFSLIRHNLFFVFLIFIALPGCWPQDDPDFIELEPGPFRAAYLIPDPDVLFERLEVIVQAGEVDNTGPEGLAHYVEHLAWLPNIDPTRVTSRDTNAWTSNLATGYFVRGPEEDLTDNLGRLMRVFEPFQLSKEFKIQERKIVRREYDKSVLENPFYALYQTMAATLLGDSAYTRSTIGSPDSIQSITIEDATAFHERTHVPSNAVFIAKGSFSESQLNAALAELPTAEPTPMFPLPKLDLKAEFIEKTVSVEGLAADELHYVKWTRFETDLTDVELLAATSILTDVLESTVEGGIATPLRFDDFVARYFDLTIGPSHDGYLELAFDAGPDTGVSLLALREAFEAALSANETAGIPAESFEKMKKRRLDNFNNIEKPERETYDLLSAQVRERRAPIGYSDMQAAIEATTLEQVNAIYRTIISEGRTVSMFAIPKL